jgi:hypothetical protein
MHATGGKTAHDRGILSKFGHPINETFMNVFLICLTWDRMSHLSPFVPNALQNPNNFAMILVRHSVSPYLTKLDHIQVASRPLPGAVSPPVA